MRHHTPTHHAPPHPAHETARERAERYLAPLRELPTDRWSAQALLIDDALAAIHGRGDHQRTLALGRYVRAYRDGRMIWEVPVHVRLIDELLAQMEGQ